MKKFNSLTPDVLENIEPVYTEALDYAFDNKDIKNIAITGIYGAGKSTVWKSYTAKKKIENIITVSLGKYEDNTEKSGDQSKDENYSNRIERQLINQMLSQIEIKKIPLSKFNFKRNKNEFHLFSQVFLSAAFSVSLLMWFLKDILLPFFSYSLKISNSCYWLLCFLFFIVPVSFFMYSAFKGSKIKVSKVNLKGAEASVNDEAQDETILDRDIKEIVYLLNSSESTVIVFEDLDRYGNIDIFTKLRELNFLLNSFVSTNGNKRIIKFVYMLKDGLFFSKNRTKFFDFIIPIVPVVDSKTSESELKNLLLGISKAPDNKVLSNISLYVDDMRLLKNIVNEFIVYSNIIPLEPLELDKNKLFALITLKNIFPNEFDLLQEDKGYIRSAFDKLESHRKNVIENFELELEELNQRIDFLNDRFENDKYEAMALMIPVDVRIQNMGNVTWSEHLRNWSKEKDKWYLISYNSGSSSYGYDDFLNHFVLNNKDKIETVNNMPEDNNESLKRLYERVDFLKKQIEEVEIYSYTKLIQNMNQEQMDTVFEYGNRIVEDHYFPLIRFLIVDGLLDETYWYYKGNFNVDTNKVLKRNDVIFLKGLLEGKKLDIFLNLETPDEIANRLNDSDFSRFNILNKKLLEYFLFNDDNRLEKLVNSVKANDLFKELLEILNTFDLEKTKKFVEVFVNNDSDVVLQLLDLCTEKYENAFKNILISIITNKEVKQDSLKLFNRYFEENEPIVELINTKDFNAFFDNLQLSEIKFTHLNEMDVTDEILSELEKIQAYKLNIDNVSLLAHRFLSSNIDYGSLLDCVYYKECLRCTKEYVESNFSRFISMYIDDVVPECDFNNSEEIVVEILLSEIEEEYKVKYLNKNKTNISNLKALQPLGNREEIMIKLLETDKVICSCENINAYWNMSEQYDNEFIHYLERHISEDNSKAILESNVDVCNSLLNDPDVNDILFRFVILYADKQINSIYFSMDEARVKLLIQRDLFAVSKNNIETLIDNKYDDRILQLIISYKEKEDDILEMLLELELEEDLLYELINSNISDSNAFKLLEILGKRVSLRHISTEKDVVIKKVMEDNLSQKNIEFICESFAEFKYKKEFVELLNDSGELMTLNSNFLNDEVLSYLLTSNFSTDAKVQWIITKIHNNSPTSELIKYITLVEEIKNIATVWENKYPKITNEFEEAICNALIEHHFVKVRKGSEKRIMLDNHHKTSFNVE
ncbi:YobI family P-loop NTPase [Enterococcus cecorum]|uniref:YobI family P-loop NTPase n=1 Tax=Enterococcus cecorum TaxID=44008 RepID=UPI003F8DEC15